MDVRKTAFEKFEDERDKFLQALFVSLGLYKLAAGLEKGLMKLKRALVSNDE